MDERGNRLACDLSLGKMHPRGTRNDPWMAMEVADNVSDHQSTSNDSAEQDSGESNYSCSCLAESVEDDASASPSSILSSHAEGPLYELSELIDQLPIKRGLSRFYHGKSQSYTSLSSVKCREDLAKKGRPYSRSSKVKSCKSSAGGGLDGQKAYSPKAAIAKKASRGSFLSSLDKRTSLGGGYRPSVSIRNDF